MTSYQVRGIFNARNSAPRLDLAYPFLEESLPIPGTDKLDVVGANLDITNMITRARGTRLAGLMSQEQTSYKNLTVLTNKADSQE